MTPVTELALLAAAVLAVVYLGFDSWRDRARRRDQLHLERLGTRRPEGDGVPAVAPGAVERRLRAAGLRLGPAIYLAGIVLFAAGVCLALLTVFPAAPIVAAVGAGFAAYAPDGLVRAWGRRRARCFETKLVDAIDHMINALAGGENATQAMAIAAEASEEPIRTELAEVLDRLALGMTVERSLARMIAGYDSESVRIFTQSLMAKLAAGGHLAPVLRNVREIIKERLKLRLQLESQLAGAHFSAILIALLPYALIPVYLWRKPDWVERSLAHPLGPQLFFFAVLLQIVGFLWLRRILRMEL